MMRNRFFLHLGVLALLLAACSSAGKPTSLPDALTEPPVASLPTPTVAPTLEAPVTEGVAATQAPEATALPVATSRGPDLHATDPTTVDLVSGGLQFVEFFRFT